MLTIDKIKEFSKKHRAILFFMAGFSFDVVTAHRIDALLGILHQGLYLTLSGGLIVLEWLNRRTPIVLSGRVAKVWSYHLEAVHFLLGTLLSLYTFFYFKSASLFTSVGFMIFLAGILIANEFAPVKHHERWGWIARFGLWSLCLISYFTYLIPILLGYIGTGPFLLALLASTLFVGMVSGLLQRKRTLTSFEKRELWLPVIVVQVLFTALYFLRWIPPVPLAVHYIGVYHGVRGISDSDRQNADSIDRDARYALVYTRSRWKFWQKGDQAFLARPGDALYGFVQVFSPSRIREEIKLRWLWKDPRRGYQAADAISLPIVGGRDQGYRGYMVKNNFSPGDWRLQVETRDGRELGRMYFTIEADPSTEPRTERVEFR